MKTLVISTFAAMYLSQPVCAQDTAPRARIYHSMVGRTGSHDVLVFGGVTAHGWVMDLQDVWTLDLTDATWRRVADLEPGDLYAAAYDVQSDRVVVLTLTGETWAFDPSSAMWEKKSPANAPSGRCGHRLEYDSSADAVILFGGFACTSVNDALLNDTWTYDYETDTWTEKRPDSAPPARIYHAMAYHPSLNRTVVWGGRTADESIWLYNLQANTWRERPATGGPTGARAYHTMTYVPLLDRLVVFGGLDLAAPMSFEGTLTNETWLLDVGASTWTKLERGEFPSPRSHHAAVYDPRSGRVIVHGGELESSYSGVMSAELWSFDASAMRWVRLAAPR